MTYHSDLNQATEVIPIALKFFTSINLGNLEYFNFIYFNSYFTSHFLIISIQCFIFYWYPNIKNYKKK